MRYLKYLKGYTLHCILAPLAKWIEAALELMVPMVLAYIIDNPVKNKDIHGVILGGIFLVILGILGFLCALFCQRSASIVSQGFGTRVRNSLYAHINTLSLKEMNKIGTASMIFRAATDVEQIQIALAMTIRLVVRAPFIVIASLIICLCYNWQIGLFIVAATILIGLVLFLIIKICFKYIVWNQIKMDNMTHISNETLAGARVVRAFNAKKVEHARFFKEAAARQVKAVKIGKISAWLNPLTYALANLAIAVVLFWGSEYILTGALEIGTAQAIIQYIVQILNAMIVMAGVVTLFAKAYSAMLRINEVFDLKSSIQNGNVQQIPDSQQAITFDKVNFSYTEDEQDKKYSLENISLQIKHGSKVAFIGGTGSGKSCFIALLTRLYDRVGGQLKIFDIPIQEYNVMYLRNFVTAVTQNAPLFTGTVRSNLQWGKKDATDEEMWEALEIACAKNFILQKDGLDTPILEAGKNLSGGQIQRLAIARAIIRKPKILILDDAFSALDFATDAKLRKNLSQLQDTTLVFISQRTSSIHNVDCIYVLSNGKIIAQGKHDELLQTSSLYQEIYHSQKIEEVNN